MEDIRTQVWSSGGGVQSSAIAALICMGELRPDLAVIIDTERELSTTWDYMDKWVQPALQAAGVTLHRVPKSKYATVDLWRGDSILIPAYTTESGGERTGKLPTYCSNEWKQRVMRRWAVDQGVKQADVWMGFSTDEMHRMRITLGKWQSRFPLIERKMNRGDCIALVKRMGWPDPPRSSCWMCPNKSAQEWRWQKANAPADHHKAIEFEREMQADDPDLWLLESGEPLHSADLSKEDDLFGGHQCNTGMCFN